MGAAGWQGGGGKGGEGEAEAAVGGMTEGAVEPTEVGRERGRVGRTRGGTGRLSRGGWGWGGGRLPIMGMLCLQITRGELWSAPGEEGKRAGSGQGARNRTGGNDTGAGRQRRKGGGRRGGGELAGGRRGPAAGGGARPKERGATMASACAQWC